MSALASLSRSVHTAQCSVQSSWLGAAPSSLAPCVPRARLFVTHLVGSMRGVVADEEET